MKLAISLAVVISATCASIGQVEFLPRTSPYDVGFKVSDEASDDSKARSTNESKLITLADFVQGAFVLNGYNGEVGRIQVRVPSSYIPMRHPQRDDPFWCVPADCEVFRSALTCGDSACRNKVQDLLLSLTNGVFYADVSPSILFDDKRKVFRFSDGMTDKELSRKMYLNGKRLAEVSRKDVGNVPVLILEGFGDFPLKAVYVSMGTDGIVLETNYFARQDGLNMMMVWKEFVQSMRLPE